MDIADRAQIEIEAMESFQRKPNKDTEARSTGFCLYCEEPLKPGQRWCDKECRDAWEYEQVHKRK